MILLVQIPCIYAPFGANIANFGFITDFGAILVIIGLTFIIKIIGEKKAVLNFEIKTAESTMQANDKTIKNNMSLKPLISEFPDVVTT